MKIICVGRNYAEHVKELKNESPDEPVIFLKPDTEEEIKAWSEKLKQTGVNAIIYRDPDAKLADIFKIPDGYAFHVHPLMC